LETVQDREIFTTEMVSGPSLRRVSMYVVDGAVSIRSHGHTTVPCGIVFSLLLAA